MTRSRINILQSESIASSRWVSLSAARLFFTKQLWLWPLLAGVMLFCVGYWLRSAVNQSLKESLESELQVVLNADVAALTEWFENQEASANAATKDNDVVSALRALLEFAQQETSPLALAQSSQLAAVKESLTPWLELGEYNGFLIANTERRIVGATRDELLGQSPGGEYAVSMKRALSGETFVSRPFKSIVMLTDSKGVDRVGVPTMFVCAPVRGEDGHSVVGVVGFRLRPEKEFSEVLQIARIGKSGETYAFDKDGLLLSESRFEDQLQGVGLMPSSDDATSTLSVDLRDPGVNLLNGERPKLSRKQLPLTLPVQEASQGKSGVSAAGHRDYRGVPQVGAWTWLKKYDFGIATEVDYAEAMAPSRIIDGAFWTMFALLSAMSLAIFGFSFVVARMQQRMQKEALKQQKLGQYHLEEKLGEGGMGVVYRGRHALLRRPTAIKLLDISKTNDASIARFEREVQLTSQLNHPNTIAIYDFGRTPEGIFYYAMEYLDGLDLERLIDRYGPMPEGRVIHILLQVCGSLAEAHSMGLVHRDIKPANVYLCRRGGMTDFVKVLDFGLVKALDTERLKTLTAADSITGTPMYIAPEGIENPSAVDNRSDLYAVGAVGYFLLTGKQPFNAANVVELCMKVVNEEPVSPSRQLGKVISGELERLILRCLAKRQSERFATISELADALRNCPMKESWTESDSEAWWQQHSDQSFVKSSAPTPGADLDTRTMIWAERK